VSLGLRAHLRSKAAVYFALLGIAALGVILFDLFMQRYLLLIYRGIDGSVLMHRTPLHQVRVLTGWGAVAQVWFWSSMVLFALGSLAVAFESLIWRLRMDPLDHAWTSMAWALRAWRPALAWIASFGASILVIVLGDPQTPVGLWLCVAPALVLFAMLPFVALDSHQLVRDRPAALWLPRWPGWLALANAIACLVAILLLDAANEAAWGNAHGGARFARFAVAMALWWFGLVWGAACIAQWLYHARRPPPLRRIHRWDVLAPLVVQQSRAFVFALFVAAPIVLLAVLLIYYIPQVEEWAHERGNQLPQPWLAFAQVARWFSAWWWLVVLTVVPWFALVMPARLLVQLGLAGDPSSLRPATHPDCDPASTAPPTA
jgi:hypothetical protein